MATRVVQARVREPIARDVTAFLRNVDYVLLSAVAGLVAYGMWVLGSVSRNDVPGDPDYYVFRQAVNVTLGVVALTAAIAVDPEVYRRRRKVLYAAAIFGLAIVFVADAILGTQSWIEVSFFRFQPSELGKVLLIIVLAGFLADRAKRITEWRRTMEAVGQASIPDFRVLKDP